MVETEPIVEDESVVWERSLSASTDSSHLSAGKRRGRVRCLSSAGFIANRRQLRRSLHAAQSLPDSALAVRLYEAHGDAAAARVAGPFSFVLWDSTRERLIAVAERSGHNRLYYSIQDRCVRLAHSVEALLPAELSTADLDHVSIVAHITVPAVPLSRTCFRNIRALSPGELLVVTAGDERRSHYWELRETPRLELADDDEYAEAYRDLLIDVVDDYLPDGAVAVALSGGMDSTSVTAAARIASPERRIVAIRALAPDLPEADEGAESAAVVRKLDLEDYPIKGDELWPLSAPDGVETFRAAPFTMIFQEWIDGLFRAARDSGAACLFSGLGGDHLFGAKIFSYADLLLTGRWFRLVADLRSHLPRSQFGPLTVLRRFVLQPALRPLTDPLRARSKAPVPWLAARWRTTFRQLLVNTSQPPVMMLPSRRLRLGILTHPSMAVAGEWMTRWGRRTGIDFRSPLADHRLAQFAFSLPGYQVTRGNREKFVVRRAFAELLPGEVVEKLDHTETTAIAMRGFRERETEKVWSLLTNMRAADLGFVDQSAIRRSYRAFLEGKTDNTRFWNTLALEAWLRQHF